MGIKNTKTYKRGFKDGWEQCKYQALTAMRDIDQSTKDYEETFEKSYDAIASMEYKEVQDETSIS